MPLDNLPGVIVTDTRDVTLQKYTRDHSLRQPAADVGPNTQPYLDGSTFADGLMVIYNDAVVIGNQTNVRGTFGPALVDLGTSEGVPPQGATGASGFVAAQASSGGGTILVNDTSKDPITGLRFQCSATALYHDGDAVPIIGIDTGPATNLAAGTILVWDSPRSGIGPLAVVIAQSDGSGLSGGADAQSDEQYQDAIIERRTNPPAAGNDAAYQAAVEKTPGLSVEKCFTVPAIKGAGTIGILFTMLPSTLGGSRIPNTAQLALVEANLKSAFPADDGIFVCTLLPQLVPVAFEISWAKGAQGWADFAPWPAWIPGDAVRVDGAITPTATSCRLTTGTVTVDPQPGQTIGFFSLAGAFFRKRILAVTVVVSTKSWTLTFDTSNNASDTTYTPVAGQMASPWSESLPSIVAPIQGYFAGLGPGEQVSTFFDAGLRQRRSPDSLTAFPSTITNRIVQPVQNVAAVGDAVLLSPTVPFATTVGTPAVSSNLIELGDVAAFPE